MNRTGIAALALTLLSGLTPQAGHSQTLTSIGSAFDISTQFSPPFREASGLGTAKNQTSLWAISDSELRVYKLNLDGTSAGSFVPTPLNTPSTLTNIDFEGVTYAPPPPGNTDDHFIYVANEASNGIVPINYSTGKYYAQAKLADMTGYTTVNCAGGGTVASEFSGSSANSGLEGITWDGDLNSFFVVKEKDPGLMIRISADLTQIQGCRVLTFSGADYSDISYDPTRGLFWIVSDEGDSLYTYDWSSGHALKAWNLGYTNGEGVAFNPADSRLYIATDNGGGTDSYLYTYGVH
jgi:hypothetical protein